jgi:hypothetical protein
MSALTRDRHQEKREQSIDAAFLHWRVPHLRLD